VENNRTRYIKIAEKIISLIEFLNIVVVSKYKPLLQNFSINDKLSSFRLFNFVASNLSETNTVKNVNMKPDSVKSIVTVSDARSLTLSLEGSSKTLFRTNFLKSKTKMTAKAKSNLTWLSKYLLRMSFIILALFCQFHL